ncbi:alpha/beta hydrolase [Seonamhaeicola algicola]|uniref:Alpha/beta hydrolase n=1 Tax=Seonamhaeicola algicola TaxID=1719036 RepID=A0A5C7AE81_9FLAO|nr:alpha/beta hydrolase [Seonamhaeicola algicola]TXE07026.1 alpha/beta hydrolase [Seonamhaeicola algicola]
MKRFLILSFLVSQIVMAQKTSIPLWPNKVPNETAPKQVHEISNNTKNNVIRISKVTNPDFLVFKPIKAHKNKGAVIICPGGGYNVLSINLEGSEVAQWLNSLGYTAFVLNYRVPQNELGALNDVQRAIKLIRNNANNYNINPNKIGVLGFSAGGSLSARAATLFTSNTYTKVDDTDDISSRPDFAVLIYPAYLDRGENRSLTPEIKIPDNAPPFFIFATADDPYGNSALVITTALRDHKIPVDLHFIQNGGHGYGLRPGNMAAKMWPRLAENWLERILE